MVADGPPITATLIELPSMILHDTLVNKPPGANSIETHTVSLHYSHCRSICYTRDASNHFPWYCNPTATRPRGQRSALLQPASPSPSSHGCRYRASWRCCYVPVLSVRPLGTRLAPASMSQ